METTTRITRRKIQMHRSGTIDGTDVVFSKSLSGWVAVLGLEYSVHFLSPCAGRSVWVAKRPHALEPIAIGKTLTETFKKARTHYETYCAEIDARVSRKLADLRREI